MKSFLKRHQKLHIWLTVDVCLVVAFFLFRGNRQWMNCLTERVTTPLKRAIGRVCYMTEISVMEVLGVFLVLAGAAYLIWSIAAIKRAVGRRWDRFYSAVLGAACIGLAIYAGFCFLWGINFWADSFQDRSGIYAEPVAREDLEAVTRYFAGQLTEAADHVSGMIRACLRCPVRKFWQRVRRFMSRWRKSLPVWNSMIRVSKP